MSVPPPSHPGDSTASQPADAAQQYDAELANPPANTPLEHISRTELKAGAQERAKQRPLLQKILSVFQKEKTSFRELIINSEPLEKRVALLVDGVLEKFEIERDSDDRMVGGIYKGRIKNLDPGLKAAFVDIGYSKNAFLHYWDMLPAAADSSIEIVRVNKKKNAPPRPADPTTKDWNPRCVAFARSHGRSPAAQLAADQAEYPAGGCMIPFMQFIAAQLRAFAAAHPEASATNNSARAALAEEPSASLGDDAEVGLIGDSVMLGAKSALQQHYPGLNVDAEVGRQAAAVIALLKHQKAQGTLPKRVVLHLGTNGYVTDTQLEEMLNLLADTHVVLINACAPRRWVDDNNALLSVAASQHPNVKLIDWNAISTEHAEYFGSDRIHLTAKGIRAYVDELKPWLPKRAEVGAEGVGITAPTGVPVSATNHGAPGAPGAPGAAGTTKPSETNPL
jgi:hypothetical protein